MSDRNQDVRRLAEELCEHWTGTKAPGAVLHVEDRLAAFRSEREAELQAKLDRLDRDLEEEVGETEHWEDRVNRLADALGVEEEWDTEHDRFEIALEHAAALQAQLHRALGEGEGLRGAVEKAVTELVERADLYGKGEPGDDEWRKARNSGLAAGSHDAATLIRVALASAPLSERAGAFIRASLEFHASTDPFDGTETRFHETADALRDELAKGGVDG